MIIKSLHSYWRGRGNLPYLRTEPPCSWIAATIQHCATDSQSSRTNLDDSQEIGWQDASRGPAENNPTLNDRPLVDYFMLSLPFRSLWHPKLAILKRDCTPLGVASKRIRLAGSLAFAKAIDRGYPDYTDPIPNSAPADEFEHMTRIYKKLQERDQLKIEKFQLGSSDQIIPLKNKIQDFKVQNIAANGKILCRDGSIHDLYAEHLKQTKGLNENGMSLGFLVTYGKFRFVSCGDYSDTPLDGKGGKLCVESELAKEMDKVNVAKINHHGHHGSPLPLVAAWAPRVWVACVWDQLHTLDVMLKRLSDRNAYPGERTIFPSVFPKERVQSAQNEDFFKDIAPETMGMGAHIRNSPTRRTHIQSNLHQSRRRINGNPRRIQLRVLIARCDLLDAKTPRRACWKDSLRGAMILYLNVEVPESESCFNRPNKFPNFFQFRILTNEAIFVTVEHGSIEASMQSPSRSATASRCFQTLAQTLRKRTICHLSQRPNPCVENTARKFAIFEIFVTY